MFYQLFQKLNLDFFKNKLRTIDSLHFMQTIMILVLKANNYFLILCFKTKLLS